MFYNNGKLNVIIESNLGKITDFIKTTASTQSPTSHIQDPNQDQLQTTTMLLCTLKSSGSNSGEGVFCSWERTDLHNISNVTFYYNRFSTSNESLRNRGRFRIEILKNNNWETIFTTAQNEGFTESATEWELINLDNTEKNYGIKMIIDEITSVLTAIWDSVIFI